MVPQLEECAVSVCESFTCVSGLSPYAQVDMPLFGRLLHELHHQLMRFAHHSGSVHTDELISGPQPAVLVCRTELHDMPYVDLEHTHVTVTHRSSTQTACWEFWIMSSDGIPIKLSDHYESNHLCL